MEEEGGEGDDDDDGDDDDNDDNDDDDDMTKRISVGKKVAFGLRLFKSIKLS